MTATALDLIVFDMAGTTIADRGQVPLAFATALAEHGLSIHPDALRAVRGASKREALRRLTAGSSADPAKIYAAFVSHLRRAFKDNPPRAIDGAESVFAHFKRRGIAIALNTGFDRPTMLLLLDSLGWRAPLIDATICCDDVSLGRPAPELILEAMRTTARTDIARVAAVGDTTLDLEAGASAGVRFNIGVTTGAHEEAALRGAPHTHIIPTIRDLPALFG